MCGGWSHIFDTFENVTRTHQDGDDVTSSGTPQLASAPDQLCHLLSRFEYIYCQHVLGRCFSPSKLSLHVLGCGPRFNNGSLLPHLEHHHDWFSHFCKVHGCDRQTDHITLSVAIGCVYVVLRCGLKMEDENGCLIQIHF